MKNFVSLLASVAFQSVYAEQRVMVWMCLEFCQESPEFIASSLAQISAKRDLITAVSFEKYTLGANMTLFDN